MDEIKNNYTRLKALEKDFIEKKKLLLEYDFNEIKALKEENKRLRDEINEYKEFQKLIQKLGESIK
jgi:cell shape-determining protein MreC